MLFIETVNVSLVNGSIGLVLIVNSTLPSQTNIDIYHPGLT